MPQLSQILRALVLLLISAEPALSVDGYYDEEDPFDEAARIERLERLGGDLAQKIDVEFQFAFTDSIESRERNAQNFAAKLRRIGYPQASAKPCANPSFCWLVIAPSTTRIELQKLIALSKELDQLAAEDYGRYDGWDCELFRKDDMRMLSGPPSYASVPTVARFLVAFEEQFRMRCIGARDNVEQAAEEAASVGKLYEAYSLRSSLDAMCTCIPERTQDARKALLGAERDEYITDTEFTNRYALPKIIQPCIAAMMHKLYGEGCGLLASSQNTEAGRFCPCMQTVLNELSESEITQLGLESADYLPRLAQAQRDGSPPPKTPALLGQFMDRQESCLSASE